MDYPELLGQQKTRNPWLDAGFYILPDVSGMLFGGDAGN